MNVNERKISFLDSEIMLYWARIVSSETESLLTKYTKHTFCELQYPIDGQILMSVGDKNGIRLSPNCFIVIPPDTYHQIIDADSVGKRFIMAFSISSDNGMLSAFNEKIKSPTVYVKNERLNSLFTTALTYLNEKSVYGEEIFTKLIGAFLIELFSIIIPHFDTQTGEPFSESLSKTESIIKYVKAKRGVSITVKELAERFGYTERHINRLFTAVCGKTASEIIAHEKLNRIEELAISTDLSLTEIADLTGFSDGYAMNKFFKRYAKTNLSSFRKIALTNKDK